MYFQLGMLLTEAAQQDFCHRASLYGTMHVGRHKELGAFELASDSGPFLAHWLLPTCTARWMEIMICNQGADISIGHVANIRIKVKNKPV